jgi:MarR family transcriptional regulator, transcriptional regulator for hemolysin
MAVETKERATDTEQGQCFKGNLGWLLYRAHWALATEMSAALAPLGLSGRQYHVLRAALDGEHTQKELAELVGLDKTTMVVTVDELERDGLAERKPSPEDRRARVIAVTKAGRRKVAEADAIKERVQADVLEALPVRQRKALLDALGELVQGRLAEAADCDPPLRRREPRS